MAHQIAAGVLASADQVAKRLLGRRRDPHQRQLAGAPGPQQPLVERGDLTPGSGGTVLGTHEGVPPAHAVAAFPEVFPCVVAHLGGARSLTAAEARLERGARSDERTFPPAFRYEGPATRARSTASATPCVHGGPCPHNSVSTRVAASTSRDASAPVLSAVAAPATI
jgi:hypothetical protein